MARKLLTLDGLKDFDLGKIDAAFREELRSVVRDLRDRPGEKSKRKVILTVELEPQEGSAGDCETAMMTFSISNKIPKRCSRTYEVGVQKDGGLVVNDLSPDDVSQGTLDELDQQ